MPTYIYECAKRHRFERFQTMTEALVKKCPTCGGKTRRLLGGGSGIIFRGAGFYATDYRKGTPPKPEPSSGAPKTCPSGACKTPERCNPATQ